MELYKWIAYADIHHDKLGAKCITIDDTIAVQRALHQRAIEGGFDFTVSAGDHYLKREPHDEVKVKADRVIEDLVHPGTIPHFHLIGNHDWVDNTRKWHTAESIKRFNNCIVMDESKTHSFKGVRIHALPADFKFDKNDYQIDPTCFNLFVFHDAVSGCFLNENKTQIYDAGLDLTQIDLPEFDLVLAGDIHIRQDLPFKHTQGGYLGSAIQRTKADANVERGWTEFTVSRNSPTSPWRVDKKFQPVRNYFTRVAFNVTPATKVTDFNIPEQDMVDQLLEVRLVGEKVDVDRLADDPIWGVMKNKYGIRVLDVLRAYAAQMCDQVIDMSDSVSVTQDIEKYLQSKFANLGGLSMDGIIAKVNKMRGAI